MGRVLMRLAVATILTLIVCTGSHGGTTTVYVDDDAPLSGDGTSWPTAFRYLQDALATAATDPEPRDIEIRIAQGVYKPDTDEGGNVTLGDGEATFSLLNGVVLRGGYRGAFDESGKDANDHDSRVFESVLSGDLLDDDFNGGSLTDNSNNVVTASAVDASAKLEALTVVGGHATGLGMSTDRGGGIVISSASPVVDNCCVILCQADTVGGGVAIQGGSPLFHNCSFSFCVGNQGGGASVAGEGTVVFKSCTFANNVTSLKNGSGGGILIASSGSADIVDCSLFVNSSFYGGAIAIGGGATTVKLERCRIEANAAIEQGGAIWIAGADSDETTISNSLIAANVAGGYGGAAFVGGTDSFSFTGNTVVANSASFAGGMWLVGGADWRVANSVFWGNSTQQIFDVSFRTEVSHCLVEGGVPWAIHSTDEDPLFVDAANGDYRLQSGSPAIDRGHNWLVLSDQFDVDADGNTTELVPLDLDGNPRFGDGAARGGCGSPTVVDIGAFEFQGTPITIDLCFGDVDGNGAIDLFDLLELLDVWGGCLDDCCTSDLNIDSVIDVFDLLDLLDVWGPCE